MGFVNKFEISQVKKYGKILIKHYNQWFSEVKWHV
jgi:hypothetical protein